MADQLKTPVETRPRCAAARAASARSALDVSLVASAVVAACALTACAQVAPRAAFPEVQTLVAERGVPEKIRWRDGSAEDGAADDAVRRLLATELTPDAAVQIALLNNPSVQATYEDLGVAQSDLVQAGLLKNPVFVGSVTFGNVSPGYDFDVAQTFLDLLLRPARERIAGAQLEEARLRVAGDVFALVTQVRGAYYTLQGAEQLVDLLESVSAASAASAELAERLHDAGNASELELASEQAGRQQAAADVLRAEADTIAPREDLRRLMGLSASNAAIDVPAVLPALPASDPELASLLALANERRLELAAARQEQTALAETLATVRQWRYVGSVDVGAMAHREQGDRNWVAGPSVSLDLPLFDQRQAEIARLESRVRQSELRAEALGLDVASDVRRAHEKLQRARRLAEHDRDALIPVRERVVALSLEHYNFMLLGAFDLLTAKQAEIAAYRDYVAAIRDYWIARVELDHAVGARVGDLAPAQSDRTVRPSEDRHSTMPPEHAGHHHGGH
ncbi:MAG TPA: TolC family protein [Candidatus Binatia bacterium]|nr:TolC family protein [Candidatus Binatia bacterium]